MSEPPAQPPPDPGQQPDLSVPPYPPPSGAAPAAPPGQQPGPAPAPYPPPGYGYAVAPATDGTAVAALVCAIVGWIACPVVLAVVALVLAGNAEQAIRASQGARGGEGLVRASRVLAWVNIGLYGLLAALALLALVVVAVARVGS